MLQMLTCTLLHLDLIQLPTANTLVGKAVGGFLKATFCLGSWSNYKYRWLGQQYKAVGPGEVALTTFIYGSFHVLDSHRAYGFGVDGCIP